MDLELLSKILTSEYADINNGTFYVKIFSFVNQIKKRNLTNKDPLNLCILEEFDSLSRRADRAKIQESCSIRNALKAKSIAHFIIDDKGEINFINIDKAIEILTTNLFSLGPKRQHDAVRDKHLLKILKLINENKEIQIKIKNISKPYSNPIADEHIINTLQLPQKTIITDVHAKRAAISALLTYLRQSVGSCFATAPCIMVQTEQSLQFLIDIDELFGTGRLKRTWAGVEYAAPISPSSGSGDLHKMMPLDTEFWFSPGILDAAIATKLVDESLNTADKTIKLKELIESILSVENYYLSSLDILELLLLKKHELTKKDLVEQKKLQKQQIQTKELIQQTFSPVSNKTQKIREYEEDLNLAKNYFKAVADNALLKAWEFTVACFAENKAGFTSWNLYSSLGMSPQDKGGIGEHLYKYLNQKLEEKNLELRQLQDEYEIIFSQVKSLESRMQHASEREANWLKAEYQSKRNEFYTFEELKNQVQAKASRYANFYNELIDSYLEIFPKYFQEVYDADMVDIKANPYDDSPAGFRLLYKFGRSNTSSWQRIYDADEFIEALTSFFSMTENELASLDVFQGLREDVAAVVTAIISHIRTEEFLVTSFDRMAIAHHTAPIKNPLQNLARIDKKPWVYTSGGSLATLVMTYFRRDQKPTEVDRWVESVPELNTFLVDIMKKAPKNVADAYLNKPDKNMLMHSPTHAFLFKPGFLEFKDLWGIDNFTYTWVRDRIMIPQNRFIEEIQLDHDMIDYLVKYLAEKVHPNHRHYFKQTFIPIWETMQCYEFRKWMIEEMQTQSGLYRNGQTVLSKDLIDGALFHLLPMTRFDEIERKVLNIFKELKKEISIPEDFIKNVLAIILSKSYGIKVFTAPSLQNICKAIICLFLEDTSSSKDYHCLVAKAAQKLRYANPKPLIFADTNWVKDYFAFMVNPGTGEWDLWRVDCLGSYGFPLSQWDVYLNGSRKDVTWGVYTRPFEYTLF